MLRLGRRQGGCPKCLHSDGARWQSVQFTRFDATRPPDKSMGILRHSDSGKRAGPTCTHEPRLFRTVTFIPPRPIANTCLLRTSTTTARMASSIPRMRALGAARHSRRFSSTPRQRAADVKSLGVIGSGQMVCPPRAAHEQVEKQTDGRRYHWDRASGSPWSRPKGRRFPSRSLTRLTRRWKGASHSLVYDQSLGTRRQGHD